MKLFYLGSPKTLIKQGFEICLRSQTATRVIPGLEPKESIFISLNTEYGYIKNFILFGFKKIEEQNFEEIFN